MKDFAALYRALDASTAHRDKQAALQAYLRAATAADAAWAVYFLAGGKPRQLVPTRVLRELARQAAGLPEWLFDESYEAVGDLAETIALLLPAPSQTHDLGLAVWVVDHLLPLRGTPPQALAATLRAQWERLAADERLVYFKLITGSFRVGVSRLQVTQALAAVSGVDAKRVAQRLMGYTHLGARPGAADYQRLVAAEGEGDTHDQAGETRGHPYPFFLAHPLQLPVSQFDTVLGPPAQWVIEWKWDGIRAQVVRRGTASGADGAPDSGGGGTWIWSRGEELVSDRFPELQAMGQTLPEGTVIDGEIVVWAAQEGDVPAHVRPFADLQKRIGRKTVTPKLQRDLPVVVLAYDLLEEGGQDLRTLPQHARRARLDALVEKVAHPALLASPLLTGDTWQALAEQREQARSLGVEGMMLKARNSAYGVGRTKESGTWWKWKIDPLSIDAVLIYAQRGHGRRASLYSDYTFAVWNAPPGTEGRALVPFAKAYSGLTDAEMGRVDAVIRKTTVESFGPVRSVRPTLVFELGFEGIARSTRHKSGIAVRFPRMLRWREDKPVEEADSIDTLAALLPATGDS
ncbi:MAG: ATP-dependent DNA ligase [Comamonadaceae bacterium]|nr:MAG: ATP-dependent DNA ligase [Comamonadaceae bacterium]